MNLIGIEIGGYRRFGDSVNVRLIESLIALVGPNEAGKTSLLNALEELNNTEKIAERDQTRRLDSDTKIKFTFIVEDSDHKDLSEIIEDVEINRCTFTKHQSGEITLKLDPEIEHDLQPRKDVHDSLTNVLEMTVVQNDTPNAWLTELNNALSVTESEKDFIGEENITLIEKVGSKLESLTKDLDVDSSEKSRIAEVASQVHQLAQHERDCTPKLAKEILLNLRPRFLLFDDEDRNLTTTYDLREDARNPPSALSNLAALAELDLVELLEATSSENIPLRQDLLEDANEKLESKFTEAWGRQDVAPYLTVDGNILHLLVRTPDGNLSRIDERSDGLRWFVALLSFIRNKNTSTRPILLVDEAESHLSYDAQANLIEVLETQDIAQKVIYTTHSAGCLPSDLGTGIRPVTPLEGERSEVRNGFWAEGPGFKPLMMAMGLSPLAFSVARNALIAEGPSETILLPTLIRQATNKEGLEYQVAPGASSIGYSNISELLSESGQSAIILDGDEAGEQMKEMISDAGADPERVKTIKDFSEEPWVFEDLIDPTEYVRSVNNELQTWQNPDVELDASDLPDCGRDNFVEEWCNENGLGHVVKPNVCQRLVERAVQGATVVDSQREFVLQGLNEWAEDHFVLVDD